MNRSVDLMGQQSGIDQAFGLHQLCHAHNMLQFGTGIDPMAVDDVMFGCVDALGPQAGATSAGLGWLKACS